MKTRSFGWLLFVLWIEAWGGTLACAQIGEPGGREYWVGAVQTGAPANPTLPFMVTLWRESGVTKGALDIPPSVGIGGAWAVELLNADITPARIDLVQASANPQSAPNQFSLVREPEGGDMATGKLLIGGSAELAARMWKVSAAEAADFMPRRPQHPLPTRPYEERRVKVPSTRAGETVEVEGVLTLPGTAGPHPAVVLVAALDVHDVDHSSMGHKPFLVLADRLARAGFATLRTQNRTPSRPGLAPATQLTIEQLGSEAAERAAWLATQQGIDPARIGLVGLNEGGTAAAVAAVAAKSPVKCLVMLAPKAMTGLDQLRAEVSEGMMREGEKPEFVAERAASMMKPYELLVAGVPGPEVISAIESEMTMQRAARRQQLGEASADVVKGLAEQQYLIINTDEFRRNLAFDPAPIFARLSQPTLAILGGKDVRFPASANAPALKTALSGQVGIEITVRIGDNLNHRLQPALSGSMDEVQEIELTIDESVLSDIIAFLSRHLGVPNSPEESSK